MSVAGYVAPLHEWETLEEIWQRALDFWKIPRFHRAELCDQLGSHMAGLCRLYFVHIVRSLHLYPFGAALPVADWHNPSWGNLPTRRLSNPYEQCLYFAFDALGRLMEVEFPDEDVAVVSCIDGPPSNIENVFRLIQPDYPRIVSATIGSPRIIPLQCADLGAGYLRESWKDIRFGAAEDEPWGDMPRHPSVRAGLSFWSIDIKDVGERYERVREQERDSLRRQGWTIVKRNEHYEYTGPVEDI